MHSYSNDIERCLVFLIQHQCSWGADPAMKTIADISTGLWVNLVILLSWTKNEWVQLMKSAVISESHWTSIIWEKFWWWMTIWIYYEFNWMYWFSLLLSSGYQWRNQLYSAYAEFPINTACCSQMVTREEANCIQLVLKSAIGTPCCFQMVTSEETNCIHFKLRSPIGTTCYSQMAFLVFVCLTVEWLCSNWPDGSCGLWQKKKKQTNHRKVICVYLASIFAACSITVRLLRFREVRAGRHLQRTTWQSIHILLFATLILPPFALSISFFFCCCGPQRNQIPCAENFRDVFCIDDSLI